MSALIFLAFPLFHPVFHPVSLHFRSVAYFPNHFLAYQEKLRPVLAAECLNQHFEHLSACVVAVRLA